MKCIDLGEAEAIDHAANKFRQALQNASNTSARRQARLLDEKLMRPVRHHLDKSERLLIAPDGLLNLVPFAALVNERGEYLINRYSIVYLTSGRDLLRLQVKQESNKEAVVLADPDFGGRTANRTAPDRDIKAVHDAAKTTDLPASHDWTLANTFFLELPGTASEAAALKSLLPDARVYTKEQATETALKQISRPRILHIATHGFFLRDPNQQRDGKLRNLQKIPVNDGRLENPYLRSGLALAGANLHKDGDDDGILTALEVAGLDLWGTKLVALSACNTGVGDVRSGEGVYGLRRALALAGSESQVMSLWRVSDRGTKDLMVAYYKRLMRGGGRGEALRQVQLQMLKSKTRSHPYYWASFIQSGEWANLDGKR